MTQIPHCHCMQTQTGRALNVVFFESGRQQVTLVSKQISGRIETTGGMAGTLIGDKEQLGGKAADRS